MKLKFALVVWILAFSAGWAVSLPYFGRSPGNKLTAADAQDNDHFGFAVAIRGDKILVGATDEEGAGSERGAAYLYNTVSGAQLRKLTASDTADGDFFGSAVALAEHHAIVGAPAEDGAGDDRGAAYVYDLATGEETFKLVPSVLEDFATFGDSVSASGAYAIVGAPLEDATGSNRGAVYVFDLTTGTEILRLTAADGVDGDQFGFSVALSGHHAIIGAPKQNTGRGALYVFDLATGAQVHKFAPGDLATLDAFGHAVDVSGSSIVVGSLGRDEGGLNRGAAYVYDLTTGAQKFKLTASDGADADELGQDVAISGNLVLVSSRQQNGGTGAVYVFDLLTGGQLAKLVSSDGPANQLGISVALDDRLAVAGAFLDAGAGFDRGAAYVFEIPDRQPDLLSGAAPGSGVGGGVFNSSAAGQTIAFTSSKLAQVSGYITVTNSGDTGDDFDLSATAGNADFAVTYLRRTGSGETNVTAALIAGTHEEPNVVPGEAGRVIRALVKPSTRLKKKKKGKTTYLRRTFVARVTATSATHDFKVDAAAVQVQTK